MKHIDADKLIAEIERRLKDTKYMKPSFDQFLAGQISAFKGCLRIIDSLQQEHPGVDLEKEAEGEWVDAGWSKVMTLGKFKHIARHFFELGLKARKK